MPIFDFRCPGCQHIEKDVHFKIKELVYRVEVCPKCGHQMVREFPKKTSFKLNGGGYHNTDYR